MTTLQGAGFEWTVQNRKALLEHFVNSGDIVSAREAIGVTRSEHLRELERNASFADAYALAEPTAWERLEERATDLANRGHDKLMTLLLRTKFPEYRDSIAISLKTVESSLSDAELDSRLARLCGKIKQHDSIPEAERIALIAIARD